jgi:hypothetical protein
MYCIETLFFCKSFGPQEEYIDKALSSAYNPRIILITDMHIIIDIRTHHPYNIWREIYAEAWRDMWHRAKPDDRISFLIYPEQTRPDGPCIVAPHDIWGWGKQPLIGK